MPPRSILLVGVVAIALLGSGLGVAMGATQAGDAGDDPQADAGTSATITVTSTAEAMAPPDVALVRPAVVATADTADAAREWVAENVSQMRAALGDIGIDDESVRTTYYDISPLTEQRANGSEIVGYRAAHGFEVSIEASPDALGNRTGAVVDALVRNGTNQIDGVRFTLAVETRSVLRRQALRSAVNDTRAEADVLATAGSLSITGVGSMSTGDAGGFPVDSVIWETAADGAGTVFDPGPVTVSATVTVTYRAE